MLEMFEFVASAIVATTSTHVNCIIQYCVVYYEELGYVVYFRILGG